MPLCNPAIIGPLNEWCPSITVEGCLPGAIVVIESKGPNPRTVAKGIAGGGQDHIDLLPGIRLEVTDLLVATQQLAGDESPSIPIQYAVPVGSAPTKHDSLSPVAFRSRLLECGSALWIKGAVPGAQVTIQGPSGILAKGRASEGGDARLLLNPHLPGQGQLITTWQEAPPGFPPLIGIAKTTTATVDTLPVHTGMKFPSPILVGDPPKGCTPSVEIGEVFDGATVTFKRASDGLTEVAIFDLDRLFHVFSKPFPAEGDDLMVTQNMPLCYEQLPSDPLIVTIAPAIKPKKPTITPPCKNSINVFVENLEPRALVSLTYEGVIYQGMVPPTADTFTFRIVPLEAGKTVTVQQERCGLISDIATESVTGTGGTRADLADPLFNCARVVRINTDPGTFFQIWADGPSGRRPISDQKMAIQSSMQVEVAPYLKDGQKVWVSILPCGESSWIDLAPHLVVPLNQDIGPVNISLPLVEGDLQVSVDAIPGSSVDVYAITSIANVEHIGSGLIDPLDKIIELFRPLTQKDLVLAEQKICESPARRGASRGVFPPIREFHLANPIQLLSHETNPKPLICSKATVVCRHDGSWEFTASLENQETQADCSFDLQFSVIGVSQPFGAVLKGDLSAAGDGPITKIGFRTKGIPSTKTFTQIGRFDGFRNSVYWEEIFNATEKFELFPAWINYQSPPDE
ncbi:hypothetical protein [Bacillus toyonensis]|uniref:hypothetical protein n=1 Tax=Bacillus toyonensis TaxID=155322 RepID=UPI000BEF63EC|nr:hypothetical protein [Bacillus toyonensis]PEL43361.1 hypothetical protein CN638_30250 [Bacillus toyonensis]